MNAEAPVSAPVSGVQPPPSPRSLADTGLSTIIEPKEPLKYKDWVLTMVGHVEDAEFTICSQYAYTPFSSCSAAAADDTFAKADQIQYLDSEWERLLDLKRDPTQELGNNPPW